MPFFQTMRLIIILSIVLLSAICSCHSSRQSVTDYADTSSIVVDEVLESHSTDEILSLLSASRELDLSGIKIEFFPPDSVHPDARAAPKSITIENAKVKETTEQTSHEQVTVDEQKTVNLSAQSSTDITQHSQNDTNILHPADWVILISILATLIILLSLFFKIILKPPRSPT